MSVDRGKELISGLVEYPLPKNAVDYVFYTVPEYEYVPGHEQKQRKYGWSSRQFFQQFYKNHREKEVGSLEALIKVLHTEVTQGGVQRIREIVIVSHANSQAMLFPILQGPQSDPANNFPYVNEYTLATFQKLFRDHKFPPALETQRAAVIAHLSDESWVTIRACNFGNSRKGLYATYSFFGGRANVYAPKLFQHFGVYVLKKFARINTPEKLHDHLVRQRFLTKEMTQERKRTVVSDFYETKMFSDPHQLARLGLGSQENSAEKTKYEALINALNSSQLRGNLVAELATVMANLSVPNWMPSPTAQIKVLKKDTAWTLTDNLTKDDIHYHIFYDIFEQLTMREAKLIAQARLAINDGFNPPESANGVILQLFLNEEEDGFLRGRLGELASYAENGEGTADEERFNAVRNLLKQNKFSEPSIQDVDIAADINSFMAEPLEESTKPVLIWPATWNDSALRAIWKVDDGKHHLLIKLENPSTSDGRDAHRFSVYYNLSNKSLEKREMIYLTDHVKNPDTPGVELAAYFDRLSLDDLASCVEYLRTPFKPGTSVYIHHAQLAMKRKKGFGPWSFARHPEMTDPNGPVLIEEEWELRGSENEDKSESSYDFKFEDVWEEVKANNPTKATIQSDLFLEEDLAKVLKLKMDKGLTELDSDSNTRDSDDTDTNAFAAQFAKHPPVADKGLFKERRVARVGCPEFDHAITRLVEIRDLDPSKIVEILNTEKTENGNTLYDQVQPILSKYSFVRRLMGFLELLPEKSIQKAVMIWMPSSVDGVITEPIKRLLEHEFKREISWWMSSEGAVLARTAMLQAGLGVIWAWNVVMVPGKMLLHIAEQWSEGDIRWKEVGHVTAIRQWLRSASALAYASATVPNLHEIDVSTSVGGSYSFASEPYWIGHYFLEQIEENPKHGYSPLVWPGDAMKEGYDSGVLTMKFKVADELVRRAEKGVMEALANMDLSPCKVNVLIKAGLLDIGRLQSQVISELAYALLNYLPRV